MCEMVVCVRVCVCLLGTVSHQNKRFVFRTLSIVKKTDIYIGHGLLHVVLAIFVQTFSNVGCAECAHKTHLLFMVRFGRNEIIKNPHHVLTGLKYK